MSYKNIEKFIKDNNINNRTKLQKLCWKIYREFKKLDKEMQDTLLPTKYSVEKHYFGSSFSTVDDFQNFINKNKISRPIVFRRTYPKIYDRLCRVLSKKEIADLKYENKKRSYSNIKSIEDLQSFIDNNDIHSRKELHINYSGLYVKFSGQLDKVIFKYNGMSLGENFLCKLFNENNIKYITQKVYPELKNIQPLRYDFYLPEYNILIEHHGEEHFGKGRYYNDTVLINDKLKYKYAITNNIPILYFTIYKSDYKTLGYFTEVITDDNILIQRIKEVGLTNQSNS